MQKIQYELSRKEYIDEIARNIYMKKTYKKKLKSIEIKAMKVYLILSFPLIISIWIVEIFLLKNIGEIIAELEALILVEMLGLGVLWLLIKRDIEERYKNKLGDLIEKGICRELLIFKDKLIINYCDYDLIVRNKILKEKAINEVKLKNIKIKKYINQVEIIVKNKYKILIPKIKVPNDIKASWN